MNPPSPATLEYVERLRQGAKPAGYCRHCERPLYHHVKGKCLFGATEYQEMTDDELTHAILRRLPR